MRVLICGDRHWADQAKIHQALNALEGVSLVIEGECQGADLLGREVAEALGIPVRPFPADWRRYGRAAGPVRNQQMLDEEQPDQVLAFHPDLARSKGTADMVRRARKAGLPVTVIAYPKTDPRGFGPGHAPARTGC
jgi:hypothetical protein